MASRTSVLALLLASLLGGSALSEPMSAADYATRVQVEVDHQNMTCSEIEYLWHVFDEMTGRCSPVAMGYPPVYLPPRGCAEDRVAEPSYRLSPDMYQSLGPALRAYLAQAGVPWDVDMQPGEKKGRVTSREQFFIKAPINALARDLQTAARLRNCQAM